MRKPLTSILRNHILEFLDFKRLSGYKYESSEYVLWMFDRYYNSLNLKIIKMSRDVIEPFIELQPNERIGNQISKATVIRQFSKYLFLKDIIRDFYMIPSISTKGEASYIPYIFTNEEYKKIISYIEGINYNPGPGQYNYLPNMLNSILCAFKILMSTGMRLGEVLNLKYSDVDFENQLFIIKEAKNNNQRIIPFSNTLKFSILKYISKTPFIIRKKDYLLQREEGKMLYDSAIRRVFYKALNDIGIKHIRGKGPRIHDMRHTFAVMSLTQLQEKEINVNLSLSYLSTYLGHKSLKETQKYIWLTPRLFKDIKDKMSDYSKFIIDIFEEEKFDEED